MPTLRTGKLQAHSIESARVKISKLAAVGTNLLGPGTTIGEFAVDEKAMREAPRSGSSGMLLRERSEMTRCRMKVQVAYEETCCLPPGRRQGRGEELMSKHGYRQFLPGSEIRMRMEIRHEGARLAEAGVVFCHEEDPTFEMHSYGTPTATGFPAVLSGGERGEVSVTEFHLEVPGRYPSGVYRASRLYVQTFGGRMYRYEGEDLGVIAHYAFEVIEESGTRPDLTLNFH